MCSKQRAKVTSDRRERERRPPRVLLRPRSVSGLARVAPCKQYYIIRRRRRWRPAEDGIVRLRSFRFAATPTPPPAASLSRSLVLSLSLSLLSFALIPSLVLSFSLSFSRHLIVCSLVLQVLRVAHAVYCVRNSLAESSSSSPLCLLSAVRMLL